MEPTSSAAAGVGVWKAAVWLMSLGAFGFGLAAIVVMCMTTPRTPKELAVALISTLVCSLSLGSGLVIYFELHDLLTAPALGQQVAGVFALGGILFACGLPGWAVVRWIFNALAKREGQDIVQVLQELRTAKDGGQNA
ncbi:MAG: hypothetical protein LBJ15_02640 [Comamonas sp.]|jgi:hypothetical protein|uniref:hypothetical protein n=1 Tax=Comamonas sp. TaxID=34028 RepID=UPI002827C368|nr:hypothetical protein [Comamonas sp.]MDR0212886.1 hypothetical protein [Comamonas sp.]